HTSAQTRAAHARPWSVSTASRHCRLPCRGAILGADRLARDLGAVRRTLWLSAIPYRRLEPCDCPLARARPRGCLTRSRSLERRARWLSSFLSDQSRIAAGAWQDGGGGSRRYSGA